MSANRGYYSIKPHSSDFSRTPMAMKTYAKKKFGPKVMQWIAMSTKGMSTPVLASGRSMAVTGRSYIDNCLESHLLPFLNTHYPHGGYIFLSDKASTHYARIATDFLDKNNFSNYVNKADNSTEVPQCRPIKDFSGQRFSGPEETDSKVHL